MCVFLTVRTACHSPTSFLKSNTFTMVSAGERNRDATCEKHTSALLRAVFCSGDKAGVFYYLLCMSRTVWGPGSVLAWLSSSPSPRGRCHPYTSYTEADNRVHVQHEFLRFVSSNSEDSSFSCKHKLVFRCCHNIIKWNTKTLALWMLLSDSNPHESFQIKASSAWTICQSSIIGCH